MGYIDKEISKKLKLIKDAGLYKEERIIESQQSTLIVVN